MNIYLHLFVKNATTLPRALRSFPAVKIPDSMNDSVPCLETNANNSMDSMMLPVNLCPDLCLSTMNQEEEERKKTKMEKEKNENEARTMTLTTTTRVDEEEEEEEELEKDSDVVFMSATTLTPEQLDKEPILPFLLKDEETELDAFLLDAVDWL